MRKPVVSVLILLLTASARASLPENKEPSARAMQTTENVTIRAKIGNHIRVVGSIRAGQILAVTPSAAGYYVLRFGFGYGFIDNSHPGVMRGKPWLHDNPIALSPPSGRQNLVTWKATPVYSAPDPGSALFGTLADNLRYPVSGSIKDRLNQRWYQIRIGNRSGWIRSLDAQQDNGIPILTWHHILRDEENTRFRHTSTTTSLRAFSNQMTWLHDRGYTTLTLYQLEAWLANRINLPARAVVITFDDGLKSVSRYACPILKARGFNATVFVISSRIKRHPQRWNPQSLQFMSLSELRAAQEVLDIQSHTHFLHRLDNRRRAILLSRSYHTVLLDLERSRRALSQFNPDVRYLSYPFGVVDDKAIKAANGAGFHMAVTTMTGKVKPGDNPLLLKRLYILRTDSLATMSRLISNRP